MFIYFLPQIENSVKMDNLVNALTYFFHQLLLGGGDGEQSLAHILQGW